MGEYGARPLSQRRRQGMRLTQEMIDEVVRMHMSGMTERQIHEEKGYAKATITKAITGKIKTFTPKIKVDRRVKLYPHVVEALFEMQTEGILQKTMAEVYGLSECTVSAVLSGQLKAWEPRPDSSSNADGTLVKCSGCMGKVYLMDGACRACVVAGRTGMRYTPTMLRVLVEKGDFSGSKEISRVTQ